MNTEQLKTDPMKETEQTLLDQIKNDVAKEKVHVLWEDLTPIGRSRCWPIVCERYAEAKAKAEVIDFNIYMTYNQDESMRPLVEELYNKFKGQNIKEKKAESVYKEFEEKYNKELDQDLCWRDIYMNFRDGEGWISFSNRMKKHFTITRNT